MKKVVFVLVLSILICGCSVKKIEEQSDAEKFAIEYNISKKNPFHYVSIDQLLALFSTESEGGIVFLGDSDNEWSRHCADILNQALKNRKVEEVFYLNLALAEENTPKRYKKLLKKVSSYLKDKETLEAPAILFLSHGEVIGYRIDLEVIEKNHEEGYSEKEEKKLKNKYISLIKEYQERGK